MLIYCPKCGQVQVTPERRWLSRGEVLRLPGWTWWRLRKLAAGGAIRTKRAGWGRDPRGWRKWYLAEDVVRR
jgi:hypothetical protein